MFGNISDSSKKLYLHNLEKLGYEGDMKIFDDVPTIMSKLPEKETTRRSYLIAIVSALKSVQPDTYKDSIYYKAMMEMNEALKSRPKKSATQEANWIENGTVLEFQKSTWKEASKGITKRTKNLKDGQYGKLYDATILSLYTLTPPRRNLDYVMMRVGEPTEERESNFYHEGKFYFNNYKTKGTYKTQVVDVPPPLQNVLDVWLRFRKPTEKGWLLVDEKGKNLTSSTEMTRTLNRIFQKPIGSSMLRSIYMTGTHGAGQKKLKADATAMGTSVGVLVNHYDKK
jgi:hypothetical protein